MYIPFFSKAEPEKNVEPSSCTKASESTTLEKEQVEDRKKVEKNIVKQEVALLKLIIMQHDKTNTPPFASTWVEHTCIQERTPKHYELQLSDWCDIIDHFRIDFSCSNSSRDSLVAEYPPLTKVIITNGDNVVELDNASVTSLMKQFTTNEKSCFQMDGCSGSTYSVEIPYSVCYSLDQKTGEFTQSKISLFFDRDVSQVQIFSSTMVLNGEERRAFVQQEFIPRTLLNFAKKVTNKNKFECVTSQPSVDAMILYVPQRAEMVLRIKVYMGTWMLLDLPSYWFGTILLPKGVKDKPNFFYIPFNDERKTDMLEKMLPCSLQKKLVNKQFLNAGMLEKVTIELVCSDGSVLPEIFYMDVPSEKQYACY
jgi:hypothetical protein